MDVSTRNHAGLHTRMGNAMKRLLVGIVGAALMAAAAPGLSAADQRGGGGGRAGGGATTGQGQRQGQGQRGPQTAAPRHPDVRQGSQNADRVRQRARDLERHASGGDSVDTMRRDRDRIREQMQDMEKAHQRWRDGLGEQDRLKLRDQLRDMDQQRDRLRTHLADLDTALAAPSPDRSRIQVAARDISRETDSWRTAWRTAAQEMPPTTAR